jgi:hypothetical protein
MRWPWQKGLRINLDQPADAFWIAGDVHRRSFTSVTDAVCFVMEELAEPHRTSAWILVADRSLTTELIRQLHTKRGRAKS